METQCSNLLSHLPPQAYTPGPSSIYEVIGYLGPLGPGIRTEGRHCASGFALNLLHDLGLCALHVSQG